MLWKRNKINAKLRADIEVIFDYYKSMWVQVAQPNTRRNFEVKFSYCPNKKFANNFLENLAREIDRAICQIIQKPLLETIVWIIGTRQAAQKLMQFLFLAIWTSIVCHMQQQLRTKRKY